MIFFSEDENSINATHRNKNKNHTLEIQSTNEKKLCEFDDKKEIYKRKRE